MEADAGIEPALAQPVDDGGAGAAPLLPAAGFDLIDPPLDTAAHELRERQIHVPGTAGCSDKE